MENNRQKIVNLIYFACAVFISYVFFSFGGTLAAKFDLEARVRNLDLWLQGIAIFAGVVTFFVLNRHQKATQFMHESVAEIERVSWPTPNETWKSTIVVIVMVIISGAVLGALDSLWAWLMKLVV